MFKPITFTSNDKILIKCHNFTCREKTIKSSLTFDGVSLYANPCFKISSTNATFENVVSDPLLIILIVAPNDAASPLRFLRIILMTSAGPYSATDFGFESCFTSIYAYSNLVVAFDISVKLRSDLIQRSDLYKEEFLKHD